MPTSLLPLTPAERARAVATEFFRVAGAVSDWDAQTPVPDWQARDVCAHFVEWVPGFLAAVGVPLDLAPAAPDDPAGGAAAVAAAVQALLDGPGADREVTSEVLGAMPLSRLVDQFYVADLFMHTWDLARSNGIDPELDPEFAANLRAGLAAMGPMLRESGQFGAERPVADDADEVRKLMAFIGRDPQL